MAAVEQKPEGGSAWKKAIRDIFITQKQVPAQPTAATASAPAAAVTQKVESTPTPSMNASGIVVEETLKKLWELIESHDQEGFDLLEFIRLLKAKKSIRDVDKYTDVYETAKALSNEKDMKGRLLRSGAHYLQVLNTEKEDFEKSFDDIVEDRVGLKKKEQATLQQDVQSLADQKAELDRQISEKSKLLAELEDFILTKEVELNREKKNFLTTLDAVVSDITSKVEGIKTHIPDENITEKTA